MSNARRPILFAACAALVAASLAPSACKRPQDDDGSSQKTASPATPSSGSESEEGESESPAENRSCEPPKVEGIGAVDVVSGHTFEKPVYVTQAPGDAETLYVVERPGRILRVRDGSVLERPFLDIRKRVGTRHQERGLLGLAFHPNYEKNGRFFIYYTPADAHQNVVAEYRRAEGEETASSEELRRLVEVDDPEDNHNGGMITFGPDGHLYVGMGDGGGAGDRHGRIGNGQNRETLLGSILRLDVDAPERGFAAADNPFAGDAAGAPQIWVWGLRNPWRFSFDAKTGELYIGDVGQNQIEEIDIQPDDSDGGENYGWRAYEGREVYDRSLAGKVDDAVEPAVQFEHGSEADPIRYGCSITGGYVYRANAIDGLRGAYLYGDYCSDDVAAFRYCGGRVAGPRRIPGLHELGEGLGSFGQGHEGELYLVYHDSGEVKRIVSK